VRLGLPVMIGFVFATLLSMVDRFFVAQLPNSNDALASIGIAFPIDLIIIGLGSGLSQGAASCVARQIGAGRLDRARLAGAQVLHIAVALLVLLTLSVAFIYPMFDSVAASESVRLNAIDCARIYLMGSIGWLAITAFSGILRGEGDTKTPMYANLASILLNLILDPIFIFDWGLGLGVQGAVAATIVSRVLASGILLIYLVRSPGRDSESESLALGTPRSSILGRGVFRWKRDGSLSRDILGIAIPSSFNTILIAVNLLIVQGLLGTFAGTTGQAALQIGYLFDQFAFLPVIGLAVGLTTVVGQNYGAHQFDRVRQAIWWCGVYAVSITSAFMLIYLIAAPWLIGIYTDDPATIAAAVGYLRIDAISLPFIAILVTVSGAFSGRGRGLPSLTMQAVRLFVIGLPLFYLFMPAGLPTFWLALPISAAVAAGLAVLWLRFDFRRDATVGEAGDTELPEPVLPEITAPTLSDSGRHTASGRLVPNHDSPAS